MILDLFYQPDIRGQYNFNPDLRADGKLKNPRQNFGSITRAVTHDIDFDNINIQYIEFFLLDPFIRGENGEVRRRVYGNARPEAANNTTGGKLLINLGLS